MHTFLITKVLMLLKLIEWLKIKRSCSKCVMDHNMIFCLVIPYLEYKDDCIFFIAKLLVIPESLVYLRYVCDDQRPMTLISCSSKRWGFAAIQDGTPALNEWQENLWAPLKNLAIIFLIIRFMYGMVNIFPDFSSKTWWLA